MNSKLSQWCEGFIEAGWVAAVIAIPLFFNIHSDRVFEPDKLTLLRSIALLMSVAWLVKFINDQAWRDLDWLRWKSENAVWRRPFVLPVFLLVVVYLLSTLFSITPQVSWAGSYQRLQGTYTTLSYIVIFALVAATMRTRAQVNRVVTAVIITTIPIAFYGMLQHFDLDPLPWGGDTQVRIAGHMGNAIFIAAYLIMALPLTLARIIDAFTNILSDDDMSYADVIRASIYIFTLALQIMAIYWSGSRGPWLGLAVGLFALILILLVSLRNSAASARRLNLVDLGKALGVVVVSFAVSFLILLTLIRQITAAGVAASLAGPMASFVAFAAAVGVVTLIIFITMASGRGWRWLWLSWILLAVFVAAWLGAFNFADALDEQFGESPGLGGVTSTLVDWKQLPAIGRLGQLIDSESRTGTVRLLIWEGALDLITPHEPLQYPDGSADRWNFLRPLLGYGPESMYVAYNRFYPPELATVEARNASPDRSHNETFDALVITGLLGFAAWQFLYLSVFYYGFRWLGVLRTNRERNLLIILWLGVGAITAVLFAMWRGPAWIGVAFPFGSMGGLVLYLVYYAFFSTPPETSGEPFEPDNLLMIGLLAAVLAHYVEIHFGIAIAATRLHFFVYVGLMYVVGYVLPKVQETAVAAPAATRSRRRRVGRSAAAENNGVWGPVLFAALMLTLVIGILGYEFTTFSPVPGETYTESADLPVGAIFRQSFFTDPGQDFIESPYVFVLLVLTWTLGVALSVAELVKSGELPLPEEAPPLPESRRMLVGGVFLAVSLVSLGLRFFWPPPPDAGPVWFLGRMLLLVWAALCLWAALTLLLPLKRARLIAGMVALVGLLYALPIVVAGGVWWGLGTAVLGGVLLWLVWSPAIRPLLLPVGVIAFVSLSLGLIYTFIQASLLQGSLFVRPTQELTTQEMLLDFRVVEASQSAAFLTFFYIFVITLLFLSAFALSWHKMAQTRESGSTVGYVGLVGLFLAGFFLVGLTNTRVIQADMIYKRGKPFDQQASTQRDIQSWDAAIAIYNKAIELAPREDFYYLFLGRAILERSALTEDVAERRALLNEALTKLERAQAINPLNTDHTANLARLNTRWAEVERGTGEFATRLNLAEEYYQDALSLSPQNSVIRNEYARLTYSLGEDCERALALFDEAIAKDPYYEASYFGRSDTLISCAADLEGAEREAAYQQALEDIETGLEVGRGNLQAWLRAAQLNQELGNYEEAIAAYQEARLRDTTGLVAPWQFDYQIATLYRDLGDVPQATAVAQQALAAAPAEAAAQVQALLQELTGEPVETPPEASVDPTTLSGERPLAAISPSARNNIYDAPPPLVIDPRRTYEAVITTEKGEMRLRLFADAAPETVNNFVFLANQGFYDGTTFHRVLDDFMAQGGDPTGTGSGGPGYQFADETDNGLVFDRAGLLAMANAGPNTNGSQFFITFAPTPWLDGNHTIFGELIAGEDVLNALMRRDPQVNSTTPGDVIRRIDIIEGE